MSLCITLATANGLVLAGDSRSSYTNQALVQRIGSDHAHKIFKLSKHCGLTTVGMAFLIDESGSLKNIKWIVDEFVETNKDKLNKASVEKTKDLFMKHFDPIYKNHLEKLKESIKNQNEKKGNTDIKLEKRKGVNIFNMSFIDKNHKHQKVLNCIVGDSEFMISGYDKNKTFKIYHLNFIWNDAVPILFDNSHSLVCSGQSEYVHRIIHGFDNKVRNVLNYIKKTEKQQEGVVNRIEKGLSDLQANIQFVVMPLQDGIDLAKLLIETTSALQKFSDGAVGDIQGGIHGVGGAVDIAVITPIEGFKWVTKKKLKAYGQEIELG